MVDIAAAITAAKEAVSVVRYLNGVKKEFDEAELKLKIAELSSSLATVQIALAEAQIEIASKDNELDRIKKNVVKQADLVEMRGFMYDSEDGEPLGIPYCPRCWTKDKELMRLARAGGQGMQCPECDSEYRNVSTFRYPEQTKRPGN